MNVLLAIAAALAAVFLALETRRRTKKRLARNSRARAAAGLALNRPKRGGHRDQRAPASLSNPLLLGLVIIVLMVWLAAAYLVPGSEPAAAVPAAAAPPAPPVELSATLAGRLTAGQEEPAADQRPALMAQAARSAGADAVGSGQTAAQPPTPPPSAVPLTEAALAMGTASSNGHLERVGLLPAQTAAKPPAAPPPAARPAPRAQSSVAASRRPEAAPAPAPAAPALPPAAQPQPGLTTADATGGDQSVGSGILNGQQEFTVHLGSFSDRTNAENYKTRLASAGETALISEITVEGRLWHRVMSGRFNTRANAEAHARDLKRRGLTVDTGRYLIKPLE